MKVELIRVILMYTGISGLSIFVLYLLYTTIIHKIKMSTLGNHQKYKLINKIIVLVFAAVVILIVVVGVKDIRNDFIEIRNKEKESKKIRVTFVEVGEQAIDLLLSGKIDPQLTQELSKSPYVVRNEVFKQVKLLTKQFSTKFYDHSSFSLIDKYGKGDKWVDMSKKLNISYFVGASVDSVPDAIEISNETFISYFSDSTDWKIKFNQDRYEDAKELQTRYGEKFYPITSTLTLWRGATQNDITVLKEGLDNPAYLTYLKFLKSITTNNFPSDFAIVQSYYSEGDCDIQGAQIKLLPRIAKLQVAAIENVSNEPIKIGSFHVKQTDTNDLRSKDAEDDQLKKIKIEPKTFFSRGILKPNEFIVLPTHLYFTYDFPPDTKISLDLDQLFSKTENSKYKVAELFDDILKFSVIQKVNVSKASVLKMVSDDKPSYSRDSVYLYGRSAYLVGLDVNDVFIPVNDVVSRDMIIRNGYTSGSCPYVYTYSAGENLWLSEGHMLDKMKGEANIGFDVKRINRFDGRLIVRENDPEIAYIDHMYVIHESSAGQKSIFLPQNDQLKHVDNNYVILRQNEQILIPFDANPNLQGSFKIVVYGYYVPY